MADIQDGATVLSYGAKLLVAGDVTFDFPGQGA